MPKKRVEDYYRYRKREANKLEVYPDSDLDLTRPKPIEVTPKITENRTRGRPRKYTDNAEKQEVYRERLAEEKALKNRLEEEKTKPHPQYTPKDLLKYFEEYGLTVEEMVLAFRSMLDHRVQGSYVLGDYPSTWKFNVKYDYMLTEHIMLDGMIGMVDNTPKHNYCVLHDFSYSVFLVKCPLCIGKEIVYEGQ